MNSLGRHILVEFFGCSSDILNDVPLIESSMVGAAADAGATVISSVFHHFSPFGVSGVVVIQESHLAIHTWPEYRYAAVDLFTCGDTVNPWISFDKLKVAFQADYGSALEMNRGQLELLERIDVDLGELRDEATNKLITPKQSRSVWFTDKNDDIALSIRHKGDRVFREKSPYQTVEIFDTFAYGKMLTIDNMVMCSEKDENAYHEMIIHVPMLLNPAFKNVLVIGGGDGGSVREILRHPQVEHVTMVEIDEAVVRASKEFLPTLSGALEDPKLDLRIEDGIAFVANAPDASYDLIVVDSSDPVGPSEGLFSTAFYQQVYRCLKPGGAIAAQSESPRFNQRAFVDIHHCLKGIFGDETVFCYLAFIPTYPTGMWSFNYATKGAAHPLRGFDPARSAAFAAEHGLQYYNVGMHQAAFALPTFVQTMLNG
ncbi:polyamine aminopropyltransferase [Nodosilinea sp. LEGE 07088]|uniref:polyamine aminopropyltransferase n=1 Tax=Nodosilinea sp. LEGE 07088 TaxID=2777968 RepID=UPI00187FEDA6|nr:polyamine aminopropyltransferase [Nodosilinea sp. LEGE 07088]MBE9140281.1 polyamine aminopropyltransferase [Nodosilinea sp. LEGE 07088]